MIGADGFGTARRNIPLSKQSARYSSSVFQRAAERGEARKEIPTIIATLPIDLFRHQLFVTRTPPVEQTITDIVDTVFLPLARPGRTSGL